MGPSPLRLRLEKVGQVLGQRWRRLSGVERRKVSLTAVGKAHGRALLSYVIDPFLLPEGAALPHAHTHHFEARDMALALREERFDVDAVHWSNTAFVPDCAYDVVVDVRYNLERLAPLLPPRARRLMHLETAEIGFHNRAEAQRLEALYARRGVRLRPRRAMAPSASLQHASAATTVGNAFTISTYRASGLSEERLPIHRVRISTPLVHDFPAGKDFAKACRRFLWLGSSGMVHKGLDLVLEAFALEPDLELLVAGPVERELDFVEAYRKELYATPSIRLLGWLDVAGPGFRDVAQAAGAIVYPSSSESGGGAVIACMHAGLVPAVTREASVDVSDATGVVIAEATVPGVRAAVRALADAGPKALEARSRAAWEHARASHTRETFAPDYRRALRAMLG